MVVLNKVWTRWIFCLVLFYLLIGCSQTDRDDRSVTIRWQSEQPVALVIPEQFLGDENSESQLTVHLQHPADSPPMLGTLSREGDAVVFEPLIPLSRGKQYDIRLDGELLQSIDIPLATDSDPPRLLGIFPSGDTLPANLLKIYLSFSRPMQVGRSLEHIAVLKNGRDTVEGVFLPLQPELWNKEGTILTVWLDPGRIKRDLQPNLRMGTPLIEDTRYSLVVDKSWSDDVGNSLPKSYWNEFFVGARDTLSPDPEGWLIVPPPAASKNALAVDFGESLDAILITEAVSVVDNHNERISGSIQAAEEEKGLRFIPDAPWPAGQYTLLLEGRLEDLAGNNLNRPFDRDLLTDKQPRDQPLYRRTFVVR